MGWQVVIAFLLTVFWVLYSVFFSEDQFWRIWSQVTLVLVICISLGWDAPSSPLSLVGRILTFPLALLFLALSPLPDIVCGSWSTSGHPDSERLAFFDEIRSENDSKSTPEHDNNPGPIDIVAVHGLASSPDTTWLGRGRDEGMHDAADGVPSILESVAGSQREIPPGRRPNWLRDFLPRDLDARVLTFNHDSRWQKKALSKSLEAHAKDLLWALRDLREGGEESRPIIMIGHSFGGLIIKQAFVIAKNDTQHRFRDTIYNRIIGFIFLGTPHMGAELTRYARIIPLFTHWQGSSTELLDFMRPGSKANSMLHNQFMSARMSWQEILCVREALPESIKLLWYSFPLTEVVSEDSAIIPGTDSEVFKTTHREIQRVSSYFNADYRKLVLWIRDTIVNFQNVMLEGGQLDLVSGGGPSSDLRRNSRSFRDEASFSVAPLLISDTPNTSPRGNWKRMILPQRVVSLWPGAREGWRRQDWVPPAQHTLYRSPGPQQPMILGASRGFSVKSGAVYPWDGADDDEAMAGAAAKLPPSGRREISEPNRIPASVTEWKEGFRVPFSTDGTPVSGLEFVPREEEIRELERCLLPSRDGLLASRKIFVLHGVGGMGKTRLAMEFAKAHVDDFDSVFFLNGKDITTLRQSYSRLLRQITQNPYPRPPESSFVDADAPAKANEWFCLDGNTKWLLIFDNIDTEMSDTDTTANGGYDVTTFFPPRLDRGSILVTTRLARLTTLGPEKRVNPMNETQARQLLTSMLKRSPSRYCGMDSSQVALQPGTIALLKRLDGLPLAIKQAGAYIVENGITIADFVRLYHDSEAQLMQYLSYSNEDRSCGIRTTWTMSFNQIRRTGETKPEYAHAAKLLRLWVLLDHRGVSFDLLAKGNQGPEVPVWFADMMESEPEFHKAVRVLINRSLVDCPSGEDSYSMHRILHDWCVWFLPRDEEDSMKNEYVGLAVRVVGYSLPEWQAHDRDEAERKLLVHAGVMYESVLRTVPDDIPPRRTSVSDERARAHFSDEIEHPLRRIARLYENQRQPAKAEKLVRRVLESLRRRNGPDDELTVLFELELAAIQCDRDPLEAEQLANHVMKQFNTVSHPSYPHALTATNLLAIIYDNTGRSATAISSMRELVKLSSQAMGRFHFRTLIYVENLGLTLKEAGQLTEAVACFDDSLARRTTELGPDHPRTLQTMAHLADAYEKKDDFAEAEKLRRDAWGRCDRKFGPRHVETIRAQDRLAGSLATLGRADEAVTLTAAAIENLGEAASGSSGYLAGCLQYNLALRCKTHGELARAEAAFKQAAEEFSRVPDSDADVLDAYEELIGLCLADGRATEAEEHINTLMLSFERWSGNNAVFMQVFVTRLAKLHAATGDFARGRLLYERAVSRFESILGSDHRLTLGLLGNYAACLRADGQHEHAVAILRRIMPLWEPSFGPRSEFMLMTIEDLADSLTKIDGDAEATRLLERAIFMSLGMPSSALVSSNITSDLGQLGGLYEKAGRLGQAELLLRKKVERLRPLPQDGKAPAIANALLHLGIVCMKKVEVGKARQHFEAALEANREAEAGTHATRTRLAVLDELGRTYEKQGQAHKAWKLVKEAADGFDDQFGPENDDCVIALENWARISASLGIFDLTQQLLLRLDASTNPRSALTMSTLDEVWRQCGRHLFDDDGEKWLQLVIALCTKFTANNGEAATVAKTILGQLQSRISSSQQPEEKRHEYRVRLYLMHFGADLEDSAEEVGSEPPKGESRDLELCQKALLLAATTGDVDMARSLISSPHGKLDLDWQGSVQDCKLLPSGTMVVSLRGSSFPTAYSALAAAASEGQLELVKLLLDSRASATRKSPGGWTPLHVAAACQSGSVAVVELLLEAGADVDARTDDGLSVLHAAATSGNPDVVQALLNHDAIAMGSFSIRGLTPLHVAACLGYEETVRKLVQRDKTTVDVADSTGRTALHRAVLEGQGTVVELLLSLGADPEARDVLGITPLQATFLVDYPMLAYIFLEKGGNDGSTGKRVPWDLLAFTVKHCEERYVQLLFDTGADIHKTGECHATLLHVAAGAGKADMTQLLLRTGIDPEVKDDSGYTALACAAMEGHNAVADVLLAHTGLDVNARDHIGRTPLSHASRRGRHYIVETLLAREDVEADPRDHYGSTPLSLAARNGFSLTVGSLLASKGVDVVSRDCFGRTPEWYALKYGEAVIARLLQDKADGSNGEEKDFTVPSPIPRCLSSRWCDVCTLGIDPRGRYYHCGTCNGGDFDVCLDCFANGARCLGADHELAEQDAVGY